MTRTLIYLATLAAATSPTGQTHTRYRSIHTFGSSATLTGLAVLVAALVSTCAIAQTYLESGGLVVMEMEETPSALGQWVRIQQGHANYVNGATGNTHLEFTGNTINGGTPASPLTFTFKINQGGTYYLLLRARKRLDGAESDKCNDCYVKMQGNFTTGSANYPTSTLEQDTKLYGGNAGDWGWATNLDGNGADHVPTIYTFVAGETYVLTISGRSIRFNLDRIVFRHSSVSAAAAKDTSLPESSTETGGTIVYGGRDDFPDITGGTVPYYEDATRDALAIDAAVEAYRGEFARATRAFDGPSGTYAATITTLAEEDGESTYRLLVNGAVVGTFQNPRVGAGEDYALQTHTWNSISLSNGDTIAVESDAHSNGLVPEGTGFAWSRGRWRQVSLAPGDSPPGPDGPFSIPGRVEAEDYRFGGEGIGYHDTTAGNEGGGYRSDNVDLQTCDEGGFNVGWTVAGEWLAYEIAVPQAGTHDVTARVASQNGGGAFKLQLDGSDATGIVPVPTTSTWQSYTNVVISDVSIPATASELRFVVVSNGFNLHYFDVGDPTPTDGLRVTQFVLVDADTDTDIEPLNDGDTLYLSLLPSTNLNIRAETDPSVTGSVRFGLDANPAFQTESVAPYALAGDTTGDYNAWAYTLGAHTVTATPYPEAAAAGTPGTPLTVQFSIELDDPGLPVVDAGLDQVVILPTNSITLVGTATDNVAVASVGWSQQAGPNTAALSGTNTLNMTASGLVQGTYAFRLTAADNEGHTAHDEVVVNVVPEGSGSAVITGELRKWHKVTLSFTGPATSEGASPNPFRDYRLNLTFSHAASGKSYLVPGYYAADGDAASSGASAGSVWRGHFAPDEIGLWTYSASFRTGSDVAVSDSPTAGTAAGYFDGSGGSFTIAPTDKSGPDLRGKGRLQWVGKHHLRFAETGDCFLKCGADAPENFLAYADFDGGFATDGEKDNLVKTWSAHVADWQTGDPTWQGAKGKGIIGAINYLASEGLNVFSFLTMNIGGDDRNVFPYTTYSERYRMDCSRLDQWEIVFEHGTRKGMYLHFKTTETENEMLLDNGDTGTQRKLYYRELIARFGHHLALNWNLGEENGALGSPNQSTAQRQAMAQYFWDHDPYRHHIVIHNGKMPDDLLGNASRLTGFSLQTSQTDFSQVHGKTKEYIDKSASAGRPWVVACDEPGDAQHSLRPDNDAGTSHTDGRKNALWGNVMAGGGGLEFYFGYDHDHSDLSCQDYRSRDAFWDYCRYMLGFFNDNDIPFEDMTNDNGLSTDANDYCLYKPNDTYVVYLKDGGTTSVDLSGATGQFEVKWYNPRAGGALRNGSVAMVDGGGMRSLGTAPDTPAQDWAILVRPRRTVSLPPPWQFHEIGDGGATGFADYTNGTFTAYASGADIWGTSDELVFISQPFTGDGEISCRVDAIQNVSPWSKVGLMFRDGTTTNAANACVVVTPGNGVSFQWRQTAGDISQYVNATGPVAPQTIRLVRRGHMFTAYFGDSRFPTKLGTARIALPEAVEVGMAFTSHSDGILATGVVSDVALSGSVHPRILFIRGGSGTGGFLEGGADDQLADIGDFSTAAGNHGWGELAEQLIADGYSLDQLEEGPATDNTPVDLASMNLSRYAAIVFGSNNAEYLVGRFGPNTTALFGYVTEGGGVLFISDANFGRNWGDAPDSDQEFLDNYGVTMNQDHGTYALQRGSGDFLRPHHPILAGVNDFDGEGVSPIVSAGGVDVSMLVRAKPGQQTRINDSYDQGSLRTVGTNDAALLIVERDAGRVACHFDRNTFFNLNGAGTSLHRHDNQTYARNLFRWLAYGNDVDGDRMNDEWEIEHFGGTDKPNGGPDDDWDDDGFVNRDEHGAGTSPTDDASLLEFVGAGRAQASNGVILRWPSVTDRDYTLSHSSALSPVQWTPVAVGIPATPPLNVVTATHQTAKGYWRVEVE